MQQSFSIQTVDWHSQHQAALKAIRQTVFIDEQHVPEALEWDDDDADATHFLVEADGEAIACARVVQALSTYKIGRMAVLTDWRRQGVGQYLLKTAIQYCKKQGATEITLSAQQYAIPFYRQAGFDVTSAPYCDAGILHVDMALSITE